ncbi:hypothetical protein HK405_011592, partial [Cladochytrium tenue]
RYQGGGGGGGGGGGYGGDRYNNYNGGGGGDRYGDDNGYGRAPPPEERRWEDVDDEEENYEDEGWLQRKTKKTQQDSVDTTRRALAKMREAEDSATSGLNTLNQQSEQLYNIEHRLNVAESHAKVSEAKASELKSLNRFFMMPTFGANKRTKNIEDRAKREMAEAEAREHERRARVQDVMERNAPSSSSGSSSPASGSRSRWGGGGGGSNNNNSNNNNGGSYKAYSTPEGLERDEREEEIDGNLDEMSAGLARLKMMGMAMSSEIESHNDHIRRIGDKSEDVRARIDKANKQVNQIMKKK